jgi:hypothetical protein
MGGVLGCGGVGTPPQPPGPSLSGHWASGHRPRCGFRIRQDVAQRFAAQRLSGARGSGGLPPKRRAGPNCDNLPGGRRVGGSSFCSSSARSKPGIGALQFGQQSPAAQMSRASVQRRHSLQRTLCCINDQSPFPFGAFPNDPYSKPSTPPQNASRARGRLLRLSRAPQAVEQSCVEVPSSHQEIRRRPHPRRGIAMAVRRRRNARARASRGAGHARDSRRPARGRPGNERP